MNEIVQFFPDADFIQVGEQYLPMNLTAKDKLKTPLRLFFPFAKGVLQLTGQDRIEYIHNMCTGDVKNWDYKEGHRTLFTNAHGKILFDTFIILFKDKLLIITDPGEETRLKKHLEQFLITEDVQLQVESDQYETIYFINQSREFDYQIPENGWQLFVSPSGEMVVFLIPAEDKPIARLLATKSQPIGLELFDELRPIQYFARAGADFNHDHLPQEASLEHAVCFNKGCYLGQEPISRIAFRGRVAKKLYVFRSTVPLRSEMKLTADDKEVGVVTSGSTFATKTGYFALGYLKTSWVRTKPRSELRAGTNAVGVVYPTI